MLSFFPRGVLDEILNLIQSVTEDFPSYSIKPRLLYFFSFSFLFFFFFVFVFSEKHYVLPEKFPSKCTLALLVPSVFKEREQHCARRINIHRVILSLDHIVTTSPVR